MKNVLLVSAFIGLVILNACNDSDPVVDPIVKTWKLDEFSIEVVESGYESNNTQGDASGNYTITFNSDLTYSRTVGEGTDAIEEAGNWEQDGDFIELDPEAGSPKQDGLFYRFTVLEITDRELDIEYEDDFRYFKDDKISEWVSDGTLVNRDGSLTFDVTDAQLDSIYNNYWDLVTETYTFNFDIVN